jgi:cation diffusion facilitator CzcD-associated flavoprotein CzcO
MIFVPGVLEEELVKGEERSVAERQYTFTPEDKRRFAEEPGYLLTFRKKIEAEINSLFGMYQQGSELSNNFKQTITEEMNRRMGPGHQELKKFIIPKWSPGCRRISPGDGYLEALVQENVTSVFSNIAKVNKDGIETVDGKQHKMDILVCATGFQVAFRPVFKVVNGEGKTLDEDWGSGVNLYMGLSAPRFPNFYTIVVCICCLWRSI